MNSERKMKLLSSMADDLFDGRDILTLDWLSKHSVTSEECQTLFCMAGMILKGFCYAPEDAQVVLVAVGASKFASPTEQKGGE